MERITSVIVYSMSVLICASFSMVAKLLDTFSDGKTYGCFVVSLTIFPEIYSFIVD